MNTSIIKNTEDTESTEIYDGRFTILDLIGEFLKHAPNTPRLK